MPSTTSASPPSSPELLESNLLSHLSSTTALEDLHATLLCSLQRMGWTEKIRDLSLQLLRAGRCERFDEVVDTVVALAEGRSHPAALPDDTTNPDANDADTHNENGSQYLNTLLANINVRIPSAVVEQGVSAIKEMLGDIIVIEDDALENTASNGDGDSRNNTSGNDKP